MMTTPAELIAALCLMASSPLGGVQSFGPTPVIVAGVRTETHSAVAIVAPETRSAVAVVAPETRGAAAASAPETRSAAAAAAPETRSAAAAAPDTHSAAVIAPEALRALLEMPDEDLRELIASDLPSLGSLTIGAPGSSILINAVNLPAGEGWKAAPAAVTWGTAETMADIQTAVEKVREIYPDTQPVFIGDISDTNGGRLFRHESHQGGRDVDVGYYYKGGQERWFVPGTAANLDLPRNWALVRALVTCTDVETIFLDTRIQKLIYKYALGIGEDKDWLEHVFGFGSTTRWRRSWAGGRSRTWSS